MGRLLTGLAMAFMIGACATDNQAAPRPALPNDISDMETHRRIEEDRRASHVAEQATTNESAEDEKPFDYEAYKAEAAAREASAAAERAAFNSTLPSSPEGMHTWVLQSVDMVTCGREGISMYCVETNAEPDGFSFGCSDEEAEQILAWFEWKKEDNRRGSSRAVDKPFHVPNDIQEPSEALDYLLTLIHHKGAYERPSVEALLERLIESFGALEIPDVFDDSVDIARWRQAYNPLFLKNIPSGPGGDVDAWGRPPAINDAFLDFKLALLKRTGIHASIVFQKWASSSERSIRYSHDYFVVLQNERGAEAAAHIDEWNGDLTRCRVANNTILEIDWDWYRSQDDEDQGRGGR